MKKLILSSGIGFACIMLTSCFGGGVVYPKVQTLDHFELGYDGNVCPIKKGQNPSESMLLKYWGEPVSRKAQEDFTVWRYRRGVNIVGVVPMVGIGIPLVIPIGSTHADFYMKSGKAEKVIYSTTEMLSAFYGIESEASMEMKFQVRRE